MADESGERTIGDWVTDPRRSLDEWETGVNRWVNNHWRPDSGERETDPTHGSAHVPSPVPGQQGFTVHYDAEGNVTAIVGDDDGTTVTGDEAQRIWDVYKEAAEQSGWVVPDIGPDGEGEPDDTPAPSSDAATDTDGDPAGGATEPADRVGQDDSAGSGDPKIDVSQGSGYRQMRDALAEEDRIHGTETWDPGKSPMVEQRADARIGDGLSWGGKDPPSPDPSATGPPGSSERETPAPYDEGDGEGEVPGQPDPGTAPPSPTDGRRDMTDFDPESAVDARAWDLHGGSTGGGPVGGLIGGSGGSGPDGDAGNAGSGGSDGTGRAGIDPGQWDGGFDPVPTGAGTSGSGSGGNPGSGSDPAGGGAGGGDDGGDSGGGDTSGTGPDDGASQAEEDAWDLVDVDGDGVPDAVVDEDGNIHEEDAGAGVGRSEDRTGESHRPSEEDLDTTKSWQDFLRGGRTPIDPSEYDDGEGSGEPIWQVRPGVSQPPDDPIGGGGGEPLPRGTMPDQGDLIMPNPLDDDGLQEPGEYLPTPLDDVAAGQAAQEAASSFADELAGGSGDTGAAPESVPLQTVEAELNYGGEQPGQPIGYGYMAVDENDLAHGGFTAQPADDLTTEVEREAAVAEAEFEPLVDDGMRSRATETDDDPFDLG